VHERVERDDQLRTTASEFDIKERHDKGIEKGK
jgi:hypothetical protein